MFKILKTEGRARRGEFTCAHGTVQTPVFQNVGTQGAIKGAVSAQDLKDLGCQIELSNTYHLHVRPGDQVVRAMGGLHKFMNWDGPILTDSGGFQVFSLAKLRKINELFKDTLFWIKAALLRHIADVCVPYVEWLAVKKHFAGVRCEKSHDDADCCRFARTVSAEKAERGPTFNRK